MHLLFGDLGATAENWLFAVFGIVISVFLALDLGLFNKTAQKISTRGAAIQSVAWVTVSMIFAYLIYHFDGAEPAQEYIAGYFMEYALSVDNIFVIILILRYFKVEEVYYHKVLFWGILGAIVMRAIFIFIGAYFIHHFHAILYFFGLFLLYTGFKMLGSKKEEEELNPEENPFLEFAKRFLRFTNQNYEGKFAIRENGQLLFTPLFMVIILIESTDLIFAIDSIPAVFAITQNEFVVYTSNIFAVMGLRAMFFLLSDIIDKFHYLQKGLAFVLMFIGAKMLIHMLNEPWLQNWLGYQLDKEIKVPISLSLGVILGLLIGSVVFSLLFPSKHQKEIKQS